MATWCDIRRTIDAGRLNGVVHKTTKVGRHLRTYCGLVIDRDNLLILRQRPEDITCPKCNWT